MSECFNNFFLLDGEIFSLDKFDISLINRNISFYEVIRLMDGRYLFLEDHLQRLKSSVKIYGISHSTDIKEIADYLIKYQVKIKIFEGNIKVVINFTGISDSNPQVVIYQIQHYYPAVSEYTNGVTLFLAKGERDIPNSKVINLKIKKLSLTKLKQTNGFETLLVNKSNQITEGSKSNVFFIKSDYLITSPDAEVLCGIMRKYVLDICREIKVQVTFESINIDLLHEFDATFITGTSIKILPVKQIGSIKYNVQNELMLKLIYHFDRRIEEYIKSKQ